MSGVSLLPSRGVMKIFGLGSLLALAIVFVVLCFSYQPGGPMNQPGAQAQPVIQHAMIDDERLAKRITDLKDEESGYTSPDSMIVDENKRCWLNPYAVTVGEDTKFKILKRTDGYHVEIRDKGVRWARVTLDIAIPEANLRSKLVPVRTVKLDFGK